MTKVLMISTDAKILEEGSDVRARMMEYAKLFSELHIVVLALVAPGAPSEKNLGNLFIYSTGSRSKLAYIDDGVRMGESVVKKAMLAPSDSVITAQDPFECGFIGRKLSEKTDIHLHVQIHTDFMSPYFAHGLLNRIRAHMWRKNIARARAVRVVSERIRQSLPPDARKKAAVLPIFADLSAFRGPRTTALREKYPQFAHIVLVASRLAPEKHVQTALKAFQRIDKVFPKIGLVIVGDGPDKKSLESRARGRGLAGKVVFEPWVDRNTLSTYMRSADVFISPSLYEGYGLSMLEAHAAGAIVVSTDAGIAPLLADDRAISHPHDPAGLALALGNALAGRVQNKPYAYPYPSKDAYMSAYKADIERALL